MTIREKIRDVSLPMAKDVSIREVRIGLRYTAVLLDNGQVGVAFTFHKDFERGCSGLQSIGPLAGRQASEVLSLFDSADKVESAVALATSNALFNNQREGLVEGDSLEFVKLRPDDTVGMVGHFAPMVPLLKRRASSLKIFEQVDQARGDLLPEWEAYSQLPDCEVALITSTSILNHTLDAILDSARSCSEVVLLGASTPIIPAVFAETPVTMLSGVIITHPQEIMRIVSEGGGTGLFRDHVAKVNLRIK